MTDDLKTIILEEISRITNIIHYSVMDMDDAKGMAYIANQLTGILQGLITISDFHDRIETAPDCAREYYYELLFEKK
jgi:hypothetical protein